MNEQQTKQPAVGAGSNDINSGTWYQSACSGLWYRNHRAAGTVSIIAIDGVRWPVGGEAADDHDERGTNEEGVRCSEWIDALAKTIASALWEQSALRHGLFTPPEFPRLCLPVIRRELERASIEKLSDETTRRNP